MLVKEVNLQILEDNFLKIKKQISVPVMAVVKANAYGLGAVPVSATLEKHAHAFCVACESEAMELVESGIKKDIIILGRTSYKNDLPKNAVPTVSSVEEVIAMKGRANRFQIKVNTGMNRMGCAPNEFENILRVAKENGLKVEGAFTHFFNATDSACSKKQMDVFRSAVDEYSNELFLHACASNALILPKEYHLNGVRMGLGMYGAYGIDDLNLALNVYATILWKGRVKKGDCVGYGNTVVDRDMDVATISIGYADGLRRNANFSVSINGKLCSNVGRVCMDYTVIDVSSVNCKVGDRAYILGEAVDVKEICAKHDIIEHEALTMVNGRARTIYV